MRRLLMRVFSVELRSSFLPWAEVEPMKGPRSRWTGIPRYPEHRQLFSSLKEKLSLQLVLLEMWKFYVGGMTPGRVKRLERHKVYG
jgi:hypothetical protein